MRKIFAITLCMAILGISGCVPPPPRHHVPPPPPRHETVVNVNKVEVPRHDVRIHRDGHVNHAARPPRH